MNSMGKNSIQIRHEINKGLCRAKHGKTNNRDIHLCTLKPPVWKQVGLQSPSNQYHFDNAPPICNPEDYVIICTGYNLI